MWKRMILAGVIVLTAAFCLTGCGDSTKTGGGGKQQVYDPGTGRYK
jgi:predicted small secreted protein